MITMGTNKDGSPTIERQSPTELFAKLDAASENVQAKKAEVHKAEMERMAIRQDLVMAAKRFFDTFMHEKGLRSFPFHRAQVELFHGRTVVIQPVQVANVSHEKTNAMAFQEAGYTCDFTGNQGQFILKVPLQDFIDKSTPAPEEPTLKI